MAERTDRRLWWCTSRSRRRRAQDRAHLFLEASSSISGGKLIYFGSFFTYALVHPYIRTCIHTYVHNVRNKHTYIRAYVRTYVHVHTRKCMYTYLHVSMLVYLTSFFLCTYTGFKLAPENKTPLSLYKSSCLHIDLFACTYILSSCLKNKIK